MNVNSDCANTAKSHFWFCLDVGWSERVTVDGSDAKGDSGPSQGIAVLIFGFSCFHLLFFGGRNKYWKCPFTEAAGS